jgi:hypothetical protein
MELDLFNDGTSTHEIDQTDSSSDRLTGQFKDIGLE